jgi:hypothetical protein
MIAHLDCSTGISGDKFLAALVDAGFSAEALRAGLEPLGLADAVRVVPRPSRGIAALGIDVDDLAGLPVRTWAGIRDLIATSALPERVRTRSLAALTSLAEAEAAVHGVEVDDVHFHEIGAADTVVDVVGVTLGLDALGIEHLTCSPVALGSGEVATAHGTLPVPAPATARLLEGVPCYGGAVPGELTTPTGAALVRTFADAFGAVPAMTVRAVGSGAGTRDIGVANVARLLLGEAPKSASPAADVSGVTPEEIVILETNIDHLSPEALAHAAERVLAAGALDVWQTPIVMKKGRAAVLLSALALPEEAAGLATRIVAETGSLGVRVAPTRRYAVPREVVTVETTLGPVRVKTWEVDGRLILRAEHDDISRIAASRALSHDDVAARISVEARRVLRLD